MLLACPAVAWGWGPATHVKLASDLLENLTLLPAAAGALLARQARHYLFGNIAADVVLAKRLSRVKQFCHHWSTGFAFLEEARSEEAEAFALGYLSHLAADTVAHNKYLPRQMTLTRTSMSFGHLYWELRADATIGPHYWARLREVLSEVYAEHERNLSSRLTDTFLPFSLNRQVFYRMNRFISRRLWLRAVNRWADVSKWHLSDQLMREYRAECLERMREVVTLRRQARVLHEDPNGNASLAYTRLQRRQLRQMARAGLIAPHLFYEAQTIHAPRAYLSAPPRPSGGSGPSGGGESAGPTMPAR